MTASLRRGARLAGRALWYALAVVLVAMALGAAVFGGLLALAERHPQRIAGWLSARAGHPVAFDRVTTGWTRRGPLLRLDGLRVGDAGRGVAIGEAEILIAQYTGLLPGRSFTELRLRGLQLALEREDDGRWRVRGLPGQEVAGGDPFGVLEGLGELQVVDARLSVHAPALGIDATVPRISLRMRVEGPRVRAAARAWMRDGVSPLEVVADIDRVRGDGRVHAEARQADLSAWSALVRHEGIVAEDGTGHVEAWAELRGYRVVSLVADGELHDLVVRGAPLGDGSGPRLRLDSLSLLARLGIDGRDWRLDAPRLRIAGGGDRQVLDGLLLAGGRHNVLRAQRLDAGPLVAALALSGRLDPGLRRWLLAARPDAVLHDIDAYGSEGGPLRARARIEDLRFGAVGDAPGLSGLHGTLQADTAGFAFEFDPGAIVRFDWEPGFGPPHDIRLRGGIAGWREGEGLRVETPALRVDGDGYAMDVRGGMWFQNDGTYPAIDMVASLADAKVPLARRFLVRHLMPDAAEQWLDAALVDGIIGNAHAVVSGDLDDWPFSSLDGRQAHGLFLAEGELQGAVVRFHPDWPEAANLDGLASFVNDGFTVKGRATIAGVPVTSLQAGIAHYANAALSVRARAQGDAAGFLALLRRSPLREDHADVFANLSAEGPASATFAMDLPLHDGADHVPRIAGEVELHGARLADARWKLAFEGVQGRARYGHGGFAAERLAVRRDGRPGTLSLRAGAPYVREAGHVFEAEADAVLPAGDLLAHAPELDWLKSRMEGRSRWNVMVAVPARAAFQGQARLRLRSDLAGTALDLPAPLRKPAATVLPVTVTATLPMTDGEVQVAFGDRLALRMRQAQGATGMRVVLGATAVAEPPPASGLVVAGRTPELDAMGWAAIAGAGDGDGPSLRGVEVVAERLHLFGGVFPDTRVTASPDGDAMRVAFDGGALAGTLRLPKARTSALTGHFQRLYWTPAKPRDGASPGPRHADDRDDIDDDIDPARLPPLQVDVDDLRLGTLVLGNAALRTRPVPSGLEIERLQTRSPRQRIDATGSWTGRGAGARTRLRMDIDSGDFGRLLAGFGFGGHIDGGEGRVRFDGEWPRGPGAFDPGALEGRLSVAVRNGRLVEVEPGAGRLLGLLSVAQLPRRLMLDFRDFFASGFAFNRIGGNVRFSAGQADSDDIVIDGPAAEIRIQGRSDLRAQVHDQRIEVLPKTGNLLAAVGAIAGGPVGAAVGAVANAVLRRPLGELNARTYRITGPWQDPKVEVTEHAAAPGVSSAGDRQ